MPDVYVRTQKELDEALANPKYLHEGYEIVVCSPEDVCLEISDSRGKNVVVLGDATVEVFGDAMVTTCGDATVRAYGNATVMACGRASVTACDTVTVNARDNSTVNTGNNSTVNACDNSTIRAWGRASVTAWDTATVRAWNRATVDAAGSATVKAGTCVPVHVHSTNVTHQGGVIIDMTAINVNDPETWCAMHLVEVDENRQAHLYKALDADLNAGHNCRLTHYPIGHVVDDTANWVDDNRFGGGLHASPTPLLAKTYYPEASRFVEVCCPVEELRPIDGKKAKAPRLRVLREVTIDGSPVGGGTR